MTDARLIYNTTIGEISKNIYEKSDKLKLRNKFVIKKNTEINDNRILNSMERTPKDIRAKSVFEACGSHNLAIRKTKTKNPKYLAITKQLERHKKLDDKYKSRKKITESIEKQYISEKAKLIEKSELEKLMEIIPKYVAREISLRFRKRKDQWWNITIPKTASKIKDKTINIFPKYNLESIKIKKSIEEITCDFQIRCHKKLDLWELVIPEPIVIKKPSETFRTVAIDPGIRTFLTTIDSNGTIKEFGKDWRNNEKIIKRINKLDKCSSLKTKKKEHLLALHRRKLFNMIDDMHKKTAKHLLDNYDVIVLPKLRTKRIAKKENCLGNRINRNIHLLAHCRFHNYLSWKAMTMGKIVIDQDESFTTQTCFRCGILNKSIGSNKEFFCENCGNQSDRDIQSSFNILTKYMGSYSPTLIE